MKITERIVNAFRALQGKRTTDPFAATFGGGGAHGFAGAQISRLTASLANWSASVNADNDIALPILRSRARQLAANNEHGRRFLSLAANNIVGRQNPKLQVRAMLANPNPKATSVLDKAANDCIETHWERWGEFADISGHHRSIYSLLRTIVKTVARDGEALVRIVRDRKLPYGIGLQLLECDRLQDAMNISLSNGNTIRQGVEIDSTGRAIAYWVRERHPGENYSTGNNELKRIPAEEMMHLFLPERFEQVRGITWFHAVIMRGSIIHRFEEAAVIAAEIGASKVAMMTRSEDSADIPGAGMADSMVGNATQTKVEAGEIFEMPPGYDLKPWNPEYPHANFGSFLTKCLEGLASGLDVAAHNLTGNMAGVNYSSARIAELAERDCWMILQDWLITSLVMPIYREWLAIALLGGKITFDITGNALPADKYDKFANASRFQGRRWEWVDPQKQAEAYQVELANQLTSRTRIAAEMGEEFDDILDELKAEKIMLDAAGFAPPPPPKPPAAEPATPPA